MYKKLGLVLVALLLGTHIVSTLMEDRDISTQELRKLEQRPYANGITTLSKDILTDYESYFLDQYYFRDFFVTLSSKFEKITGKVLTDSIYRTSDNTIITFKEFIPLNDKDILKIKSDVRANVEALYTYLSNANIPMSYLDTPYKYDFYAESLPSYMRKGNMQELYINDLTIQAFEDLGIPSIRGIDILKATTDKPTYYKTDTHYNGYGALLVYMELYNALNPELKQLTLDDYKEVVYKSAFEGNYVRQLSDASLSTVDTFSYYYPSAYESIDALDYKRYESGALSEEPIMSPDTRKAIYGNFVNGDKANSVFVNDGQNNGKKILIIGDSFTNALEFYAIFNYEEVHSLDLRHFKGNVIDYISANGSFDDVVIVRRTQLSMLGEKS